MKSSKLFKVFQLGGYTPTNLQNFNYVPTYAGQPLEAQKAVGDRMLDLYNTNLAQASAVDIMNAQRQVVDGDADHNQEITKRYKEELDAIAKSGDYENMTMRVNALARKYQTDPDIKAVSESRANWERREKMAEEIRMKTGRDPLFMDDVSKHKTVTVDPKTGQKTYNVFRSRAEAPLDWQAKRQDIWNVIQPDVQQLSKDQVKRALTEIPGYIATGTWRGIGDVKIKNFLDEAISAYQGTPEYRQELRYLQETEPGIDAEKAIKTRVLKEGILKTFSQVDPGYMKDWILEDQMAKTGVTPPALPNYEEMPALKVESLLGFDPEKFEDRDRDTNDNPIYAAAPVAGLPGWNVFDPKAKSSGSSVSGYKNYKGQEQGISPAERQAWEEAVWAGVEVIGGPELAKQAAEQGSEFLKSPQANKFASEYANFVKARYQNPISQPYDESISKTETFQLKNYPQNRLVLDLANPEDGPIKISDNGKVSEEYMELIGSNANNITVSGYVPPKNSYGKVSGNPLFSDAQVITVHDAKGQAIRQLLVTRPAGYYNTPEGQERKVLGALWNNLALNPGKLQKFNVEGLELEAKTIPDITDPSGKADKVLVYKVGTNDYSDNPIQAPSYESLVEAIFSMQK